MEVAASFARKVVLVLFMCQVSVVKSSQLPNFVLINLDDVGWGDIGILGEPSKETPNIDRMAQEGMLLTNFYTAAPLCSPSRASMLTGRLPIRNGFYQDTYFGRNAYTPQNIVGGIASSEILISELLAKAGYYSAVMGKWHLGQQEQYHPLNRGFDEYFGAPNVHFHYDGHTHPNIPVYKNRNMIGRYYEEIPINLTSGIGEHTQSLKLEALNFIKERSKTSKPFLLYWNPDSTHAPTYSSKKFRHSSRRGSVFGDALREIDEAVGEILDSLREHDIDNNTLVILTSDNGPALVSKTEGGSNGPFLCGKQTTFEGGFRTPGIFRWPTKIPPKSTSHQIATQMDLFATFADLAGIKLPRDRLFDSTSLAPVLLNSSFDPSKAVFFYRGDNLYALRVGSYKMHLWTWATPSYELEKGVEFCPGQRLTNMTTTEQVDHRSDPLLFHLERDPGERYPISHHTAEYRQEVDSMLRVVEEHEKTLVRGKPALNYCDIAVENWAPSGCEKLNDCLPVPPSDLKRCYWGH